MLKTILVSVPATPRARGSRPVLLWTRRAEGQESCDKGVQHRAALHRPCNVAHRLAGDALRPTVLVNLCICPVLPAQGPYAPYDAQPGPHKPKVWSHARDKGCRTLSSQDLASAEVETGEVW